MASPLNGHEFGWTPGVGDGQGGLACSGSWGHKESDTTEQLNHHLLPRSRIGWLVTEVIRLRIVNSFLEEPILFLKIESSR